jgi:hypothetical protein
MSSDISSRRQVRDLERSEGIAEVFQINIIYRISDY